MQDPAPQSHPPGPARDLFWKRRLAKVLAFSALLFLVLNPNLKRAALQVRHVLHPEGLIQTNFPALPRIHAQLDRWLATPGQTNSEARLIGKLVLQKIRYVSDYENWANLEYWPRAEEVWEKRQEDCDGRAILATSLLRARGFRSAGLVVGLDHMWVMVDENEKDPAQPPRYISLLSPDLNFSVKVQDDARTSDFLRLAKAVLRPTALRETGTHLFADIPVLRKVVLVLAALLLLYHPCKSRTGLFVVMALGLASVNLLADWRPGSGNPWTAAAGGLLLLCALASAMSMEHWLKAPGRVRSQPGRVPVSAWR